MQNPYFPLFLHHHSNLSKSTAKINAKVSICSLMTSELVSLRTSTYIPYKYSRKRPRTGLQKHGNGGAMSWSSSRLWSQSGIQPLV